MRKDPNKVRDPNRPESQRIARDAADPERTELTQSLGEYRRKLGPDPANWPAAARKRFEAWHRRQLERKAAERSAWRSQRVEEIDQALAALDDSPAAAARATALRDELARLRAEVTNG